MLTPAEIEALSDPIVEVYKNCVDEILVNIARHLKADNTGSLEWQIQKLGEFGQLRRENINIIKQHTGNIPQLVNGALGDALTKTLTRIDPLLSKAAALGLFAGIDLPPTAAQEIENILTEYSRQAVDQMNLVNTVMLDHSLQQYRQALADTTVYEMKLDKAQAILNEQTGTTVTGVSSRQQAVRKAVQQMNRAGLSGFRDAGGHRWSAEAYVNMDIRTTAHNVATQAVFTRNEQYGNALVSVSAHAGARELCYPYQGKVYSTDGSEGYAENLHGRQLYYEPIENTSYGLPAGLLGINCGHFISPFIPGLSVIRDVPQEQSVNDAQYALSQQQRMLEREVRYAKREAAMMDAMGDKEGFEKAAAKVQRRQENLDKFISNTGRTKRVDRTQVQGYNRSVASNVGAANSKKQRSNISRGISSKSRYAPNGLRASPYHVLTKEEIQSLKEDIKAINADMSVFVFNAGGSTRYRDELDIVCVCGDVLPDKDSTHPRDLMSSRAVLAHEYYGHRANRGTTLKPGAWNDEFRASYMAAKNCPNLSTEDRRYLILDAIERAKESGVSIRNNEFMRGVLYGAAE